MLSRSSAEILESAIVGDELQVTYTPKGAIQKTIAGKVVFIFTKGIRPRPEDIAKYHGIEYGDTKFYGLQFTPLSDRLVLSYIEDDETKYHIFQRTPVYLTTYDAEIKLLRPVLRRRERGVKKDA